MRIRISDGRAIDPLSLNAGDLTLDDVARTLAAQCRWRGFTNRFYSVAEHSCRVSAMCEWYVKQYGIGVDSASAALVGLLHDVAELVVADIPAPIKKRLFYRGDDEQLVPYVWFEDQITEQICGVLEVIWPPTAAEVHVLGVCDRFITVVESHELGLHDKQEFVYDHDEGLWSAAVGKKDPIGWESRLAMNRFRLRFKQLRETK